MDFVVFKAPMKILFLKISYVSYGTSLHPTGTHTHECLQLVPCLKLKHSYTVYIITALIKPYGPFQENNVPCESVLAYLNPFTIQYTLLMSIYYT